VIRPSGAILRRVGVQGGRVSAGVFALRRSVRPALTHHHVWPPTVMRSAFCRGGWAAGRPGNKKKISAWGRRGARSGAGGLQAQPGADEA